MPTLGEFKTQLAERGLPTRAVNALAHRAIWRDDLRYVDPAELPRIADDDLLAGRNFGPQSLADVRAVFPAEEV